MDATNGQNNNGTTINNSPSGSSNKPPPWVWVLVALASALTLGVLLYGGCILIRRRRAKRHQLGDGPADGDVATRGGGLSSPRRPWDRRRRRSRSQPGASRWPWVHSSHRASTQSSEGLNELGEAPPPYNEDDLEPCLNMSMVEVNAGLGLAGGPSRVASRQDRVSRLDLDSERQQQEVHPQPPTYDFAMNLGTAETTTAATISPSSIQPPPPAIVVSEDRSMRVE